MKLNRLITLLLVATLFATASYGQTQTPIDIALWPNGATEKNADEGGRKQNSAHTVRRICRPNSAVANRRIFSIHSIGLKQMDYPTRKVI